MEYGKAKQEPLAYPEVNPDPRAIWEKVPSEQMSWAD